MSDACVCFFCRRSGDNWDRFREYCATADNDGDGGCTLIDDGDTFWNTPITEGLWGENDTAEEDGDAGKFTSVDSVCIDLYDDCDESAASDADDADSSWLNSDSFLYVTNCDPLE